MKVKSGIVVLMSIITMFIFTGCGAPKASPQNQMSGAQKSCNVDKDKQNKLQARLDAVKSDFAHVPSAKYHDAQNADAFNQLGDKAYQALNDCRYDEANDAITAMEQMVKDLQAYNPRQDGNALKGFGTVSSYVVRRGDTLWGIAKAKFNNPFFWPLIYWSNSNLIKDPDLIFPKQEFVMWEDYYQNDKDRAAKFAKTRGPWSLYDGK